MNLSHSRRHSRNVPVELPWPNVVVTCAERRGVDPTLSGHLLSIDNKKYLSRDVTYGGGGVG